MTSHISKIEGLILGTAVGDSIGLPTEGLSPARIKNHGYLNPLQHRFIFRRGMWSDDTEQTIMLTQALLGSQGDITKFVRSFSWELRWWILGLPAATGLATAKAIIKLWLGVPPHCSGIFSAGNGSAMRAAPVAAMFPDDRRKRQLFTEAQTRVTHSDPKALIATLAIVELVALFLNSIDPPTSEDVFYTLHTSSSDSEWLEIINLLRELHERNQGCDELLNRIGGDNKKGISGYVYQTVPCAILVSLNNEWDFKSTIREIISAGGDTDTSAAIAGALCGAHGGVENIPEAWIHGIAEWPCSKEDLSALARALRSKQKFRIRRRWSPALILRNITFLGIVLIHAFARLIPPSFRSFL